MKCENPTVILNPNIHKHSSYLNIIADGKKIPIKNGRLPSPRSVGATPDNYMNYNIVLPDGECIPLYILVPCGKCLLCRDKKAKDMATRATCETAAAEYPPLFVTLTYEDNYLPEDGVNKRDVQLFLKRFREIWFRLFNHRLNLRYFCAAEYGSRKGRPHYHLLFWNVPNGGQDTSSNKSLVQLQTVITLLTRAWSVIVDENTYSKLPDYLRYSAPVIRYGKERIQYYRILGRIDVSQDRGSSAQYCMKYMYKGSSSDSDESNKYKNPTFTLASRGNGGIGVPYLKKHLQEFRNNTWMTKLPPDVGEYGLPRIFKEYLWPSTSKLIDIDTRCHLERFSYLQRTLSESLRHISSMINVDDVCLDIYIKYRSIEKKYGSVMREVLSRSVVYSQIIPYPCDNVDLFTVRETLIPQINMALYDYDLLYQILRSIPDQQIKVCTLSSKLKDKRNTNMSTLAATAPPDNVSALRYNLLMKINERQKREVF